MRFVSASISVVLAGCAQATAPTPLPAPRAPGVAAASSAAATEPPRPKGLAEATEPPTQRHRYYGWVLPLELAGVFTAEIGWLAKRDAPANEVLPYGAPVVVAMPLVHALYGNGKTALASLGLRTALYGGAFAAFQADVSCSRGESLCIPLWSIMALTAAATISSIVDLKWAYVDEPHAAWRKLPVIPSVQPTGHGGTFALTAIF